MKLFVLSDPHLGQAVDKPMDRFGRRWERHAERLAENWRRSVGQEDLVLLPGDISWAMSLDEALPDLRFLDRLPGEKILLRGNHDYWWQSLAKVDRLCAKEGLSSLRFLQNNALTAGDFVVAGSRLWLWPDDPRFQAKDRKILDREVLRLKLSLTAAAPYQAEGRRLFVMLHYPPFAKSLAPNILTAALREAGAEAVFFGHIHQEDSPYCLRGSKVDGLPYYLSSADFLEFQPLAAAASEIKENLLWPTV